MNILLYYSAGKGRQVEQGSKEQSVTSLLVSTVL